MPLELLIPCGHIIIKSPHVQCISSRAHTNRTVEHAHRHHHHHDHYYHHSDKLISVRSDWRKIYSIKCDTQHTHGFSHRCKYIYICHIRSGRGYGDEFSISHLEDMAQKPYAPRLNVGNLYPVRSAQRAYA